MRRFGALKGVNPRLIQKSMFPLAAVKTEPKLHIYLSVYMYTIPFSEHVKQRGGTQEDNLMCWLEFICTKHTKTISLIAHF